MFSPLESPDKDRDEQLVFDDLLPPALFDLCGVLDLFLLFSSLLFSESVAVASASSSSSSSSSFSFSEASFCQLVVSSLATKCLNLSKYWL